MNNLSTFTFERSLNITKAMKPGSKRTTIWSSASGPWWPGKTEPHLFMTPSEALPTKSVKEVFAKKSTNFALVPGRLTSVLQPLLFLEKRNSRMQWMADGIHDFTVTDHTKKLSFRRFHCFTDCWPLSDIKFSKMIASPFFFKCIQNMSLLSFVPVLHNHFYVFCFLSFKVHFKIGVHVIHGCALFLGK